MLGGRWVWQHRVADRALRSSTAVGLHRETREDGMNAWADLNHLQTGRYGEYFAKMALVRAGFDAFSPEVDDKGIDSVLRIDGDPPRAIATFRSRPFDPGTPTSSCARTSSV
jgi:hypothetical protein